MTPGSTRKILQDHGLAPKKRLGQNFLTDRHTAEAIVAAAAIDPDDVIIEVGTGLGALTNAIAARAGKVIGIEIDSGIIRYHQEHQLLADNVRLIHGDILKTDFAELASQAGAPLKIIANLPYSISNPFLFKLIDYRQYVDSVLVMLQKEVAERLRARPSTKEYGIPTVLVNRYATVTKILTVGPEAFHPRPKIDSLVIRLDFHSPTDQDPLSEKLFQQLVRACFAKRRKTLLNNLAASSLLSEADVAGDLRQMLTEAIETAGLSPVQRAETLTAEEFAALGRAVAKLLPH